MDWVKKWWYDGIFCGNLLTNKESSPCAKRHITGRAAGITRTASFRWFCILERTRCCRLVAGGVGTRAGRESCLRGRCWDSGVGANHVSSAANSAHREVLARIRRAGGVAAQQKRMGVTRKQDEALTSEQVRALQELGDVLWERAEGVEEKRRIANVMAFAVIGFCASLRGEEVPLVSLKGLVSFWEETMMKGFLMLTLRGRFKGENNLKWHLVPVVDETNSGIRARRWVHRLVHLRLTEDRVEEGPLFIDGNGRRAKMRDFNSTFQEFVGLARDRSPEAFSSKVEIEDYNLRRSLRRGSTTQAHNNKTPVATIELVNRWRKREAARGAEPGLEMRQVYTQALTAVDATLEYSRNL